MSFHLIRFSDKYKKVVMYNVLILNKDSRNLSLKNNRLKLTYKNESTITNITDYEFNDKVGAKLKVIMRWINKSPKNSKSFKLFYRYIKRFYPEELL